MFVHVLCEGAKMYLATLIKFELEFEKKKCGLYFSETMLVTTTVTDYALYLTMNMFILISVQIKS